MLTIIPARSGSRRIPSKNIKYFHGKPIIAYSIELAKQVSDEVYVSTDGPEIVRVASKYGANIHHRPPELARDEIGTQEVVGAALRDLGVDGHTCVMALYATSPLLTLDEIRLGRLRYSLSSSGRCHYSADKDGQPTGGFYIADAYFFMDGMDPYEYGEPVETGDIDINTPEDWERAERLYEERINEA